MVSFFFEFLIETTQTKRACNNFTDDQEENILICLKGNPILYNKSIKEYKMQAKKSAMCSEKVLELQISGELSVTFQQLKIVMFQDTRYKKLYFTSDTL